HTEEEAKQLRCCGPKDCGTIKSYNGERNCVGSACMAWVWEPVTKEVRVFSDYSVTEVETVIDHEALPTHGRCGLVKG
ncbi:MAG: hypothetical protein KDH96_08315, partial [Candidatus Riesia sp.]|nr:hypothetical protein [Candidatus Riesia sp.]